MSETTTKVPWLDEKKVLIFSVFVAGLCSIIYELLISTASSYFQGDSIKQFSITIGIYMAAMGLGSYLSRLFNTNLLGKFIVVEIILGFIGGVSVPILYAVFAYADDAFLFVDIGLITLIGTLTGLEVPLLTRMMEDHYSLKVNLSNVLSLDYLGALLATLAFPFVLLPLLGTFKSSLIFGIINMSIGFLNLWYFADKLQMERKRVYYIASFVVTAFLLIMLLFSQKLLVNWSNSLYQDRIVYQKQTPYQQLVLTRYKDDVRLYINGGLQFSSVDEYRYHEPLVHVPLFFAKEKKNILVLGGGDGLATREILKYPDVKKITVVDLDPEMFKIARTNSHISKINERSFHHPKVSTIAQDAFIFVKNTTETFDVVIADLPDPNNVSLSRLYSKEFYQLVKRILKPHGVFVTQSTSPYFATKAYWSIVSSVEEAGYNTILPYHSYVPSFGDWGFTLASKQPISLSEFSPSVTLQYLDKATFQNLFLFAKDEQKPADVKISTIDKPSVLDYYLEGWKNWN